MNKLVGKITGGRLEDRLVEEVLNKIIERTERKWEPRADKLEKILVDIKMILGMIFIIVIIFFIILMTGSIVFVML